MTLPRLGSTYPQCMYDSIHSNNPSTYVHHDDPQVMIGNATSTTEDDHQDWDTQESRDDDPRQMEDDEETANTTPKKLRSGKKGSGFKSMYKHVPHKDKPPHLVARRNARERRRVQAVNSAFARLRKCVPVENRNKRLSKVKTLHKAIEYIGQLQDLIDAADSNSSLTTGHDYGQQMINKENGQQRWTDMNMDSCKETDYDDEYAAFCDDFVDYAN